MKVGAVVANLAPSKSGMVAAWLVRTLLVTVGNRADSEGVEVATVLSKLAVSSLVEFAASLSCTSHCGHLYLNLIFSDSAQTKVAPLNKGCTSTNHSSQWFYNGF